MQTHIERKPRIGSTEQDGPILPLPEVSLEVFRRRSPRVRPDDRRIGIDVVRPRAQEVVRVHLGLLDVPEDVHREPRGLGYRQAEVERDRAWDTPEPDDETPHLVEVLCGVRGECGAHVRVCTRDGGGGVCKRRLPAVDADEGYHGCGCGPIT